MPRKKTESTKSTQSKDSQNDSQEEQFNNFQETSHSLIDSMNGLSKSMNTIINVFDRATESMQNEESNPEASSESLTTLMKKVNTVLDQNNKIAQGMVTILEQVEEIKKEQNAKIDQLRSFMIEKTSRSATPTHQPIKPEPTIGTQPSSHSSQQQPHSQSPGDNGIVPPFQQTSQPQRTMPPQEQALNTPQSSTTDDFRMDDLFNNYPPAQSQQKGSPAQQPQQNQPVGRPQPHQTPISDMPPIDPFATQNNQLKKTDLGQQPPSGNQPQQNQTDDSKKPLFKNLFKK